MEFAEWVVAGLDQYRTGQLPGGDAFFQAVWSRLGGDARLTAFMNTGDPAARQALVALIGQAVQYDPGFEQQLRAAVSSQPTAVYNQPAGYQPAYAQTDHTQPGYGPPGYGAPAAKPSFFKTTGGIITVVVLVLALVGGIGLAVGLGGGSGGGGGSSLAQDLRGTWHCTATAPGGTDNAGGELQIGDGTWSAGDAHGTWKQDGSTVKITYDGKTSVVTLTGVPDTTGPFDATIESTKTPDRKEQLSGSTSKTAVNLKLSLKNGGIGSALSIAIACTR
jgi:hypothetical protein